VTAGSVAIVGAGLAGLVAARALVDAGRAVTVLERDERVGGRIATDRLGEAVFDSGAQFLNPREDAFAHLMNAWRDAAVPIREWCRGFVCADSVLDDPQAAARPEERYPRYMVDGGMHVLTRRLAAGIDVRTRHHVVEVEPRSRGWRLRVADGDRQSVHHAELLMLTPPGASAQDLLGEPSGAGCQYASTVTLLVALDGPSRVPAPGAVQCASGPIRWLADNAVKGISPVPALTAHATDEESADLIGATDTEIRDRLLPHLRTWMGAGEPTAVGVRRWRYARPLQAHADPAVVRDVDGSPLVLAGDGYGGSRAEGAAISGLAAAAAA
jgi:renalase